MQFKDLNKKFKSIELRNEDILFTQGDKTGDGYIIQFGNIQLKLRLLWILNFQF